MTTVVAIDGSALGNPGPAGWAWYVDENCWAAGGWPSSSNNRGELTALLELLKATAPTNEELHVLADSQYVINSVTKWMSGWKKRGWRKSDKSPVLNADLMQAIDKAITGRKVSFEWVRGHSGHPLNEAADDKARAAATAYQRHVSVESGPGWTRGENKGTTTTAPGSAQGSTAVPGSAQGANFPSRAEAAMTPGLPRTAAHASSRVGTSTSQPQQNVTALQQQIAQTQREIASEQQKIVAAQQSIAVIQKNLTAAQQSVVAIHKKATDAQQSIVTIQQKIAAAQQKIAKIQQKIASAQQTVTSAQQEILSTNRHGGHAKPADPNPDTLF